MLPMTSMNTNCFVHKECESKVPANLADTPFAVKGRIEIAAFHLDATDCDICRHGFQPFENVVVMDIDIPLSPKSDNIDTIPALAY